MKYALKVRYIGKNYYGSQIQFENGVEIDKPTIQGILEKAICTVTGDKITETNKKTDKKQSFPAELIKVSIQKDRYFISEQTNILLLQSSSIR